MSLESLYAVTVTEKSHFGDNWKITTSLFTKKIHLWLIAFIVSVVDLWSSFTNMDQEVRVMGAQILNIEIIHSG